MGTGNRSPGRDAEIPPGNSSARANGRRDVWRLSPRLMLSVQRTGVFSKRICRALLAAPSPQATSTSSPNGCQISQVRGSGSLLARRLNKGMRFAPAAFIIECTIEICAENVQQARNLTLTYRRRESSL